MESDYESVMKKQQVIEMTSFIMHKHYCENDIEAVISFLGDSLSWFGAAEHEYAVGYETITGIFRQFSGQIPECIISDEEYHVITPCEDIFICTGRMWISTAPSAKMYLRTHQRVTMVYRYKDGKFDLCHIHLSNPYEMAEHDIGFPTKVGHQTFEYLREQIDAQRKLIQEQMDTLSRLSFEDSMTGLYNRNKFNQVVKLKNGTHSDAPLGLAYFDLNGLKKVNDTFGHRAGDELILRIAGHIRRIFDGKAYRIGGDEFLIIEREMDEETFLSSVRFICKNMEQDGISVSTGICWESSCTDILEQFERADKLMYEEKRRFYSIRARDRRR